MARRLGQNRNCFKFNFRSGFLASAEAGANARASSCLAAIHDKRRLWTRHRIDAIRGEPRQSDARRGSASALECLSWAGGVEASHALDAIRTFARLRPRGRDLGARAGVRISRDVGGERPDFAAADRAGATLDGRRFVLRPFAAPAPSAPGCPGLADAAPAARRALVARKGRANPCPASRGRDPSELILR
jgi:hypothetical protein